MYRFMACIVLVLILVVPLATLSAHAAPPNIILIMADDIGYECLGANGSTHYKTPRLDALAQQGIRFTQAHSQPLCTPTRVKIMTGLYNFRNYTQFGYLDPAQTTFAQVLKKAGYATAIAGKWQLGHDKSLPAHFGFDEHCLWQLTYEKKQGERYANPLIERNGEALPRDPDAYGPDIFLDFCKDFITRKKDAPFLLYFPMALVHDPFVPTPDTDDWAGDRYAKAPEHFAEMVTYMDKNVGLLVDHVASLGLSEKTLFIFTGDNGTNRSITSPFQGRMLKGGKGTMLDSGTHVPMVAWWPGHIEAGRVYEGLIGFEDFFPTLLETAGITDYTGQLDGKSFLPLLKGEAYTPKPWLYCHYDPRWGNRNNDRGRSARTPQYKLYADGRFLDVLADPDEEHPLDAAGLTPELTTLRAELQGVLDAMEKQGSVMSVEGAPKKGEE